MGMAGAGGTGGIYLGFHDMGRREGKLGYSFGLGEHSVMFLTCSLEKSSRRKSSFDTHCLANYLHARAHFWLCRWKPGWICCISYEVLQEAVQGGCCRDGAAKCCFSYIPNSYPAPCAELWMIVWVWKMLLSIPHILQSTSLSENILGFYI